MIPFIENTSLKEAALTAICLGLTLLLIFSAKSGCEARSALEMANSNISLLETEKSMLQSAISLQNDSIDQRATETEKAQLKSEAALKLASEKNRSLEKSIKQIRETKVNNCEDTAPIVANVIEALREGQ